MPKLVFFIFNPNYKFKLFFNGQESNMYVLVFVKSMLYVTNVLVLITVTNVIQPKKITQLLAMLIW